MSSDKLIEAVARELHHAGWEKDYWTDAAKQVLSAIEAAGYRVVPVEPTDEMAENARNAIYEPLSSKLRAKAVYTAMLADAPKVTP